MHSASPFPRADDAPLLAAEHALLALRSAGLALAADLERWAALQGETGRALVEQVMECRAQLAAMTAPLGSPPDASGSVAEERDRVSAHLAVRLAACARRGEETPLLSLARAGFEPIDLDLLLVAALSEESSLWGSLFSYLAGSASVRRPTVHMVLNFGSAPGAREETLARLCAGPLVRHGLLRLEPEGAPLADRTLCLAAEAWLAIRGVDAVDPLLAPLLLAPPAAVPVLPMLSAPLQTAVQSLAQQVGDGEAVRAVLVGTVIGSAAAAAARWIASANSHSFVEVNLPSLAAPGAPGIAAAAVRHALVRGATLILHASPGPSDPVVCAFDLPPRLSCLLVLPDKADLRGHTFAAAARITFTPPPLREREEAWRRAIAGAGLDGVEATELARRYRLADDEIAPALAAARHATLLAGRADTGTADVARAIRDRPAARLEALAGRRVPRAAWNDLVLPDATLSQLDELCSRLRHRDRVFDEWGVVAHTARQNGVLSLFAGPTGTGKTLAAEVIAGRLDLDLFCVDISQVVSKYIGETEKNLARVFDAVESASAVLFFDEADGIFGKRTEAKDAHDRYANQEVSYLLSRLETFGGLAILATNLRQNIDPAFVRRMDFIVEFAQPDTASRRRLWERHLVSRAPLGEVDLDRLAAVFAISGAQIRNAVVGAAFRAAAEGGSIEEAHLVDAMRREYEKLGKPFPALPPAEPKRRNP